MLVVGAMAVVENRVLRREITGLWAQPGVDIVGLDGDDAAIMTRSGNLRWRLIGDGSECCCPLIPLAVSIDHASGKIAVKLVQKGIEAEIAALDGVAFRQRADREMFVNFASALDLPVNSANASLLDISTNTKVY